MRILYKPGSQIFNAEWLSRHNHKTNRDEKTQGIDITITAIESCMGIQDCIMAEEIRMAMLDHKHIGILLELVFHGWSLTKSEVQKDLHTSHFRDESAIIDTIAVKGGRIIPAAHTRRALNSCN